MKNKIKQWASMGTLLLFVLLALASPFRIRERCNPLGFQSNKNLTITVSFINKITGEPIPYFNFKINHFFYEFVIEQEDPCLGHLRMQSGSWKEIFSSADAFGQYFVEQISPLEYKYEKEYFEIDIYPQITNDYDGIVVHDVLAWDPEEIHLYFYALPKSSL